MPSDKERQAGRHAGANVIVSCFDGVTRITTDKLNEVVDAALEAAEKAREEELRFINIPLAWGKALTRDQLEEMKRIYADYLRESGSKLVEG